MKRRAAPPKPYLPLQTRTRHRPQDRPRADVQSRRAPALITPVKMPDSPHTSAPMVMQGRALALKNTCRNASSTSVEKHLSWSPDIHPTARWVPSTPHRARPAGHPPTRHPGAVDAKERECNVGHYVEADDEEETRPTAAVPPSVRGAITSTRARPRPSTTGPVARPVRLPRRSTPHHRGCARRQDRDDESAPRAQPEGRPHRPLPRRRHTRAPVPAPQRRAAREARSLSEAPGPSTVALQQRCHRASASAWRPS